MTSSTTFTKSLQEDGHHYFGNNFLTFEIPNEKMSVHWCFSTLTRFNTYIPLSTDCFDIMFHDTKVIPEFIDAINKAVGKNGLFTGRSRAKHWGLCSYLGEQAKKLQNIPSPSEGPSEHGCRYLVLPRVYQSHILVICPDIIQ